MRLSFTSSFIVSTSSFSPSVRSRLRFQPVPGDTNLSLPPIQRQRRTLLGRWLYFRSVLYEFRWSLLLLGAAVVIGAFLFSFAVQQDGSDRPSLALCLYASWMAMLAP